MTVELTVGADMIARRYTGDSMDEIAERIYNNEALDIGSDDGARPEFNEVLIYYARFGDYLHTTIVLLLDAVPVDTMFHSTEFEGPPAS